MSTTLRGPAGVVEVLWWWETPRIGRCLSFRDRASARAYVDQLGGRTGNLAAIRRFVKDRLLEPSFRLDDATFLDEVSWWLTLGKLRIAAVALEPRPIARTREAEIPPIVARAMLPVAIEPEEVVEEGPTFPEGLDVAAIVSAKKEAAQLGIPFCEECMKKAPEPAPTFSEAIDAAASAAVLKRAAQSGAPFCEECMKKKAAAAAIKAAAPSPSPAPAPVKAPEPVVRRAPLAESPTAPPDPTFAQGVDNRASAAVLKDASKKGLPFCEECMKKKLAEGAKK